MGEFSTLLQQGNGWVLHSQRHFIRWYFARLEPQHSKTAMAAFISRWLKVRQTGCSVWQQRFHTAIVWLIACWVDAYAGHSPHNQWNHGCYFNIILSTACWMFWRTWRGEQQWLWENHHHDYDHDHDHDHTINLFTTTNIMRSHTSGRRNVKAYQMPMPMLLRYIQRRFDGQTVTTGQILFGLTEGLSPSGCDQCFYWFVSVLKAFTLGATMVLSFSLGPH